MSEVYIRASDKRLFINGRALTGRIYGAGLPSEQQREVYIDNTNRRLCWVDDENRLRCAKGVDVGASGGLINGTLDLYDTFFVAGGRRWSVWRNLFRNNVAGTTLLVYSNSARTNLVASVQAGTTATYLGHRATYYLRLRGNVRTQDTHDLTVNAHAGFTYTASGSYTPSSDANYECEVTLDKVSYGNTCAGSDCTNQHYGDNSCSRSSMRTCIAVDPHEYGASYERIDYKCKNIKIGDATPAAWSVTVAES